MSISVPSGSPTPVDVVVIGAGQAGLSSAYFLDRYGFAPGPGYVVLDRGEQPGGAWQHRWPSLRLGTTNHVHDLPGLRLADALREGADPAAPASAVVSAYFAEYERRLALPVRRPVRVAAVRRRSDRGSPDGGLLVETDQGVWAAGAVVNATGTWDRPFWPVYPGMRDFAGRQLHTVDYRGPAEFAGQRVVVVGGGISAIQLLMEISRVATTTWVTRRPPLFREGRFDEQAGRAAVALVEEAVRAGRPPASVVSVTGLPVTHEVRQARADGVLDRQPMFDRLTPDGVAWDDGRHLPVDVVLWCTGFRPVTDHLAPLALREAGGGIRMDGTRAVREPRLHLVGYGPSASTVGATRAGRAAAREIRRLLGSAAAA